MSAELIAIRVSHEENLHLSSKSFRWMKAFMKAGLKVPGDISVIGFDDIAAASYVQPPLTTIAGRKRQMGRAAIEMLLNLLKSSETVFPETMKLPVDLIVRESTGPPA